MNALHRLRDAYDERRFSTAGLRVLDQLRAHLETPATPVLPWREPLDQVEHWEQLQRRGPLDLEELAAELIASSQHVHHPRYLGHQVTAPLPTAALADLISSLLNNSGAVYEMSPAHTGIEAVVIRWLSRSLGWTSSSDGFLTNGGTIGNLTALLAMRQAKSDFDVWQEGSFDGPRFSVLVNEQAHYSIARAAQVMGWGRDGAITVATDASFRMTHAAMQESLSRAQDKGRTVIGVAANAGSTATGSFDQLHDVADFCESHGLWMHVDGAHGASVCFSEEHRPLIAGIERADSVVWDAHKMMMMPALVTAVLFRDEARSFDTFSQAASYLFEGDPREEWHNGAVRTFECTRQTLGLKLFAAWVVHGEQTFADYVDVTFDLARQLAELLQATDDFELAMHPQSNIVCFRHRAPGVDDLDGHQRALRQAVIRSGEFYLVQTDLPGGTFLRTVLMNPFTTVADLQALLDLIRELAKDGL